MDQPAPRVLGGTRGPGAATCMSRTAAPVKPGPVLLAAILACAIAAPLETSAEDQSMVQETSRAAIQLPIEGKLPSFGTGSEWLNSPPLSAASLRGKVVVVE